MAYNILVNYIESNGFKRDENILNRWFHKDIVISVYFDNALLHYDQNNYTIKEEPVIYEGTHKEVYDYIIKYFRKGKLIRAYND
jgi:hypothetical protein